ELVVERIGANAGTAGWRPQWRTEQSLAGGGILVDHGTHLFYQLHALFGSPQSLSCRTERRLPGYSVDDTAQIELHYASGVARLRLTWAGAARHSTHRYRGELGEIECVDDVIIVRSERGERCIGFAEPLSKGSAHSDWFVPLLAGFADRIARRDRRLDALEEAVTVAAYISHAYESAARDGEALAWRDPLAIPVTGSLAAAD
ncbi:MAG TPA: Gfo/Idh/MocA family oxidoreductase, partial [Dehalococcoidia bacterium]